MAATKAKRRPGGGGAAADLGKIGTAGNNIAAPPTQPPDWFFHCRRDQFLCLRPESCRKCTGRLSVGYLLDFNGHTYGRRTEPHGACGNPYRRGERPLGITPAEAFGWPA